MVSYSSTAEISSGLSDTTATPSGSLLLGMPDTGTASLDLAASASANQSVSRVARTRADLDCYDALGIDQLVSINCWGRSGSWLLASFLDGHDDVIMLPMSLGQLIYDFWEEHEHLPLRDKLLGYPKFVEQTGYETSFFKGEFGISESDYQTAVAALLDRYRDTPAEVLSSRANFVRFLHVAYTVVLGRRPVNPRPLIVYQQHGWSEKDAERIVSDFPRSRFLHTVRDPISTFDGWFERRVALLRDPAYFAMLKHVKYGGHVKYQYPAWRLFRDMVWSDGFHTGLEDRSINVRFEDLHTDLVRTMTCVAKWLGLAESPVLFESTFNGQPWVVQSGGKKWTGARPEQARRRARNMYWGDRAVLFALFHENFVAWGYDHPRFFASGSVRGLCLMLVLAAPMRLEFASDLAVIRTMLLPAIRSANFRLAAETLWRTLIARAALRALIFRELCRGLATPKKLANPI